MLLRGPERHIHDQSSPARDHHRCRKLTCTVMRTHTGAEHRIPTPDKLIPEWLRPGENAILDHILVATPHIIHKYIDGPGFAVDLLKSGFHLCVEAMVAADACDPVSNGRMAGQ